jgi:GAF domain-containing protein
VTGWFPCVPKDARSRRYRWRPWATGHGVSGRAAEEKTLYISDEDLTEPSIDNPRVCVPLVVGDKLLGLISVYSFLSHKSCISELDRELFKLLGGHAAMALYAARLDAEARDVRHDASDYLKLLNV